MNAHISSCLQLANEIYEIAFSSNQNRLADKQCFQPGLVRNEWSVCFSCLYFVCLFRFDFCDTQCIHIIPYSAYPSEASSVRTINNTTSTTVSIQWAEPATPGKLKPLRYLLLCESPKEACQYVKGYNAETKVKTDEAYFILIGHRITWEVHVKAYDQNQKKLNKFQGFIVKTKTFQINVKGKVKKTERKNSCPFIMLPKQNEYNYVTWHEIHFRLSFIRLSQTFQRKISLRI